MTKMMTWSEMEPLLENIDVIGAMEEGFRAYSNGLAVIPPVGELCFDHPPGDVHIKYGYLRTGAYYVVKIASGFYDNPKLGLPSSQGLMLLFSKKTGQIAAVLLDEGRLTDIRTGAAGAVAARYLGPKEISQIGIIGTGIQARVQLEYLERVTDCRKVMVWGRSEEHTHAYARDVTARGFEARVADDAKTLAESCNLIVTTTPSREPLLQNDWIRPGTHITAVGADSPEKQELDSAILGRADVVVADSISQCLLRGEINRAITSGHLKEERVVELGAVLADTSTGRVDPEQITVADLTGVAVQDLQIAAAVYGAAI